MNKFLTVMGAIFCILIVVLGVGYGLFLINGNRLDAQSKAYAENILPPLLSNFTTDNFVKYVAPENQKQVDHAALDKFTSQVTSIWGAYKSFDDLKGESIVNYNTPTEGTFGRYVAKVTFEKGTTEVQLTLTKLNGAWSLVRIDFAPPAATQAAPATPTVTPEAAPAGGNP